MRVRWSHALIQILVIATGVLLLLSCSVGPIGPTATVPSIASFTATPPSITVGQTSNLSWTASGATALDIDHGIGTVTGTSKLVRPSATTTYTLAAANSRGSATAITTVTVFTPGVITSFIATPATITSGQSSTLSWTVTGTPTLSIDQGIGAVTGSSTVVSPTVTTTYTLTATHTSGAPSTATTTVTVNLVRG